MRTEHPAIAIVIPAHNEEAMLQSTVAAIRNIFGEDTARLRFVLVDDGSTDSTWGIICRLADESHGTVTGLRLSRNFGKDAAIIAGLAETSALDVDAVVTLDADGQHPPSAIPAMIDLWQRGTDVVNGIKQSRAADGLLQKFFATAFNRVFSTLTQLDFANASDFKLLDRSVAKCLLHCKDQDIFYRALVAWIGFNQTSVPFVVAPASRKSRWTTRSLIKLVVNGIVMFSDLPIYFVLSSGMAALALSIVLLVILLFRYFTGNVPSGYPTLLVLQLATLSLTVAAIGAVGLYVRATLAQARGRPRYVVQATSARAKDGS